MSLVKLSKIRVIRSPLYQAINHNVPVKNDITPRTADKLFDGISKISPTAENTKPYAA